MIVRGSGDGEIQNKLNFFREAFGDISISPYVNRIFVVLYKTHSVKIDRLVNQGVPRENINVWSMNGIEYYPKELVSGVFNCSIDDLNSIDFESGRIEFNGIIKTKKNSPKLSLMS